MKNTTRNFVALEAFDTLTLEEMVEVSGGGGNFWFSLCQNIGFCSSQKTANGSYYTKMI